MSFQILTDSCCDLSKEMLKNLGVLYAPLTVTYDENTVFPDGEMDPVKFYEGVRAGKMPQSAAVNPDQWMSLMKPALESGLDVLVINMASGISATHNSAKIAANELTEDYPDRKILVVDSTTASLCEGLMVMDAARMRDEGKDAETVAAWLEENKTSYCIWITVEDLNHLKRGGRVSPTTAVVGTLLQIKPTLFLNDEGKLESGPKARGRKASLNTLVEKLEQNGIPGVNDTITVGHANAPEDAQYVADLAKAKCGVKNVVINSIGNVIGTHVGPGTVLIGFRGTTRT